MKKTRRLFLIVSTVLILASCSRNPETGESKSGVNEKPPTVNFEFPDESAD